jgi:hypothetical protein
MRCVHRIAYTVLTQESSKLMLPLSFDKKMLTKPFVAPFKELYFALLYKPRKITRHCFASLAMTGTQIPYFSYSLN